MYYVQLYFSEKDFVEIYSTDSAFNAVAAYNTVYSMVKIGLLSKEPLKVVVFDGAGDGKEICVSYFNNILKTR